MEQANSPRRWPRCSAVLPWWLPYLHWLEERLNALEAMPTGPESGGVVLELFAEDERQAA